MTRWISLTLLIGAIVIAAAYWYNPAQPVAAGDTVSPVWSGDRVWAAGEPANFGVRLRAHCKESDSLRLLGFSSMPQGTTPEATVTFFNGSQEMSSEQVVLSHRC